MRCAEHSRSLSTVSVDPNSFGRLRSQSRSSAWCAARRRRLATPGTRRAATVRQDARLGERRLISDVAAFAFPGGVLTAGTGDASDIHVSRQQPVAPRAAVGSSVHLLILNKSCRVIVSISSHKHHTGIRRIAKASRLMDRYPAVGVSLSNWFGQRRYVSPPMSQRTVKPWRSTSSVRTSSRSASGHDSAANASRLKNA